MIQMSENGECYPHTEKEHPILLFRVLLSHSSLNSSGSMSNALNHCTRYFSRHPTPWRQVERSLGVL